MVKNRKTNPINQKVGIAFDEILLEQLDEFAHRQFDGNRSDAARYILKKYFKKTQSAPISIFKPLTAF